MPNDKAYPDLFENQSELPEDIRRIVADYSSILEAGEVDGYSACEDFLKEARELGYTFEFGLDGVPYGLREASDEELSPAGPAPG